MRRGTSLLLLFIVLLALGAAFVDFWPNPDSKGQAWHGINNPFPVKLGLDLQGGVSVILTPKQGTDPNTVSQEISSVRDLIARRVSGGLGVSEPDIRVLNNRDIDVELAGLKGDPTAVIQSLLQTGNLEYWITGPQTDPTGNLPQGTAFDPTKYTQYNGGTKPAFTGANLDPAQISAGQDPQTGKWQINFEMKPEFLASFGQFTQKNTNNWLTITLDRKVISSAVILGAITGPGQLTGNFTHDQAQAIATTLQYGALPIPLQIASQETIGATLGQDSIQQSAIAGAIGLGIVILFMLFYYRLPGVLASVALILYSLFTFAVFKLIGATLTLAGIAGFILSIGMAVDANVLIFERTKEELRAGRMLASAIDIGWKRAWPSIRDSNSSTLITCAILFYFGSSFGAAVIQGFATTLFLGVAISMFTAIVVTQTFLNLLVPTGVVNHPALFGLPAGSIATASLGRRNNRV